MKMRKVDITKEMLVDVSNEINPLLSEPIETEFVEMEVIIIELIEVCELLQEKDKISEQGKSVLRLLGGEVPWPEVEEIIPDPVEIIPDPVEIIPDPVEIIPDPVEIIPDPVADTKLEPVPKKIKKSTKSEKRCSSTQFIKHLICEDPDITFMGIRLALRDEKYKPLADITIKNWMKWVKSIISYLGYIGKLK